MKNKFDELAKGMAQSVTRRQALKKFSLGLAGMALACFGLATGAKAAKKTCLPSGSTCSNDGECCSGNCLRYTYGYGGKPGTNGGGKKFGSCY